MGKTTICKHRKLKIKQHDLEVFCTRSFDMNMGKCGLILVHQQVSKQECEFCSNWNVDRLLKKFRSCIKTHAFRTYLFQCTILLLDRYVLQCVGVIYSTLGFSGTHNNILHVLLRKAFGPAPTKAGPVWTSHEK